MLLHISGETWGLFDIVTNSWVSEGDRVFLFHDVAVDDRTVQAAICARVAASLLGFCSCETCKGRIQARVYDETITGRLDIKSPALWRSLINIYLTTHHPEAI